jgi:hypothetical protein
MTIYKLLGYNTDPKRRYKIQVKLIEGEYYFCIKPIRKYTRKIK